MRINQLQGATEPLHLLGSTEKWAIRPGYESDKAARTASMQTVGSVLAKCSNRDDRKTGSGTQLLLVCHIPDRAVKNPFTFHLE